MINYNDYYPTIVNSGKFETVTDYGFVYFTATWAVLKPGISIK